ncbi:hypothetical protein KM043_017956 [Ampulex compressa]|nr:hypothetical protein KM043_017956 [Ampulex compressa]
MDSISWQFLSLALNNDSIVMVMTMHESVTWDDLSKIEADIYNDSRLKKNSLAGLEARYLAAFACQFLNVVAIPTNLERILRKYSGNSPGWCEAFLTLALQRQSLDFVAMSPAEVERYSLVFPDSSLVMKVPKDLLPDEVAPSLHWSQMSSLNVCVTNEKYIGLRREIYDRMNPYEQSFLRSAAVLGTIFTRSALQSVMLDSMPLHTAKTVSKMIRIRILECASIQRRGFYGNEFALCTLKKRITFSDMHHLIVYGMRKSEVKRQSVFSGDVNDMLKKRGSVDVRRVSVMPTYLDDDENGSIVNIISSL